MERATKTTTESMRQLTAWGPFEAGGYINEVDIKVQLKATIAKPTDDGSSFSYFLRGLEQYNDLRADTVSVPRILVVLFLASPDEDWLTHSPEQLVLKHCAWWQSLRGAPAIDTATGTTVKLPKKNMLTPQSLISLAGRLSHGAKALRLAP